MRHQLIGLLGGGVEADRVIDAVMFGERHLGVAAVNTGTGGVHQMRYFVVAAAFENIGEADDVALDVGVRILQRVTDASLRGQVNDLVEFFGGKQHVHPGAISDIQFDEAEVGMAGQSG
jgi:hypothetical protein